MIDDCVFENIFIYTRGVPRKVNLLCDRILLYSSLEELHVISNQIFLTVMEDVEDEFWSEEIPELLKLDNNDIKSLK
jgi:hypothetical protein